MGNIIEIENLSYQYPKGHKPSLLNINLAIKEGEFVVVMGKNGAGKSTLLLTLNGIIPNSFGGKFYGRVIVDSMDTVEHRVYELAEKVGMVIQDPEAQLFMPTVKDEIAFGLENLAVPKDEILRRINEALKIVRLEGFEDRSPFDLSGGQKQRVAIAAAFALRPKILVLDEPTSQLDPKGTLEVFQTILNLKKKYNITIVMAEHKSDEVAKFADRIVLLDDGKIVREGKPKELFSDVDLFKKLSIKVPQICELTYELNKRGKAVNEIPITLDEAVITFSKYIEKIGRKIKNIERKEVKRGDEVILETKGLWHIYPGNVIALKNVNFSAYKGDFIAIIGQNGAGKTTLVKHFLNLLQPTKGEVLIRGKDVTKMEIFDLSRHIGLILQNPDHQLFSTTVYKEVEFGPKNLNLPEDEIAERVKFALESVGLWELREEHPFALSWGDRQKLAVAAVLAMKPEILIFDEPTTGMDWLGRHQILNLAKELNKKGHTIIMITHDMELVAEYAKWTMVMGLGEILLQGPTYEVFKNADILAKTYLSPPQVTQLAQSLSEYGIRPDILTVDEMIEVLGGSE